MMKKIAHIESVFPSKFGIPRQSGLADELRSRVVFEPEYRVAEALRGIEGFEYLWLIWEFSESVREDWSPTVRPPRLGGNARLGVFATRSPFRPNPIGLSSVRLEAVEWDAPDGPALLVSGADLMNGTPIFDIKPYLPYTDSHPEARSGFADGADRTLAVTIPEEELEKVPEALRPALVQVLAQDPRPSYHRDPEHVYGFYYDAFNVRFRVKDGAVRVVLIENRTSQNTAH